MYANIGYRCDVCDYAPGVTNVFLYDTWFYFRVPGNYVDMCSDCQLHFPKILKDMRKWANEKHQWSTGQQQE